MFANLVEPLLAGFKASISILLTLCYGWVIAYAGLLSPTATKEISHVAMHVFLPFLIVTKIGPQLSVDRLRDLWVVIVWAIVTIGGSHLWGYAAHKLFKWPAWISPASGLCNATAMPMLLLDGLKSSGTFDRLLSSDESVDDALDRAKSIVLLNALVQQTFAFTCAQHILREDDETPADGRDRPSQESDDEERVGLLTDYDDPLHPLKKATSSPTKGVGVSTWSRVLRWTKALASPPLIGAAFAVFFGLIPALHHAFLTSDGALYSSITQSWRNVGDLFNAFQMVALGAQLQQQKSAKPPIAPSIFVLVTRFILMPALSLSVIYATAGRGIYPDDPVLWLCLILVPAGPTALILSSLSQLVEIDVGPISGFIAISYLLSPLLSFTVALAFVVIDGISDR